VNLAVNSNTSAVVGDRFSINMIMWPVNQRTVVNGTFKGVIPQTLRVITLAQSISPGEAACYLMANALTGTGCNGC
jgi:hypothetical protein